ncbi:MAG: glutamate-5-semialdehyde dehydrogenase [Bifidobacteriaceae bacterium]|jgi:glutamate-5-semialdehyde dehydrogenase|nr:glutamate-5-semialdehyde dehydrogenase [Bifidobacteriaceae bacterium]
MSQTAVPDAVRQAVEGIAMRARSAGRELAQWGTDVKDAALHAMATALVEAGDGIVGENRADLADGERDGLSAGLLDRLRLDSGRIAQIADALREVAGLPDPVGEVLCGRTLPNGLRLRQIRVPMGVVGMIYEARPGVTVDAAGLAVKSGNAVILRGGSAARRTNGAIVAVLGEALEREGLPRDAVQTVDDYGRDGARALMTARGMVDLLIPRGGAGLIQTVVREATVPCIETGVGNCHVYVDSAANLDEALRVVVNSKAQRPSVCNAAETLLVNQQVAQAFLPVAARALAAEGVKLHADPRALALIPGDVDVVPATEADWSTEYLSLDLAVGVVEDVEDAIEHIQTYSSGHTEAICTRDLATATRFVEAMDSAAVIVNASTRFTDGGQFGLGAEIGISTQKLHARGPMGLTELTTTKWVVWGDGQIRT